MDKLWRIELLGWLRAARGDQVVSSFRRRKIGSLLAYLAYHRHRSHPRDQLVEMLWPERDPEAGRRDLRVALSSLRCQLEPPGVPPGTVIIADRDAAQLNPAACATDVAEFEAALRGAERSGSSLERVQFLEAAVALYHGELLPGYFEDWIVPERLRLSEAFLQAFEPLIALLEQGGDSQHALQWARRAISADPLREEARRDLIRLLAASGHPEAAIRAYEEFERLLKQELDVAPEEATRVLVRQIRQAGSRAAPPPGAPVSLPLPVVSPPAAPAAPASSRSLLPTGTVTFLLTDIEGHTALWERAGNAFSAVLESHHALLREQFRRHGGHEVKEIGDGFLVAFSSATDALTCAIAGQRALASHPWPPLTESLRVRMALHTGDVQAEEGDYHSLVLNLASRMLLAGHGGQILCSEETAALLRRNLEAGIRLIDLGVYRLKDVAAPERLFQVDYPEMTKRVFPPLRAEAGYASRLPPAFTRFFGREEEIARLLEILLSEAESGEASRWEPGSGRLVTLTGPAGTGKTRLALAVAARLQEAFQGAVWFVPLADLVDPQRIADQILHTLPVPPSADREPLEQVMTVLARQPSFLLLDNMEHLVRGGRSLVEALQKRVRTLTLLVTSRRRLDLPGEREFPVPPLPAPGGWDSPERLLDNECVRLFVDRAQAVRPDFRVTPRNARAVAGLCESLEGLPLALELAAARSGVLTPAQMLPRLQQRFELLERPQRKGRERHWSLRAALDWSYQLLPPELRQFFARLAVFRGGWTLEAAERVCEAPEALEYLEQLQECSLLIAEEGGDEIRFRMLETLREYAREQLDGEASAFLGHRHAEYYLALAEEAEPRLMRSGQGEWLDRLEREHENLRAALQWLRERGRAEEGLRLGGALAWFSHIRGYWAEGRAHLETLLALPGATARTAARAKALDGAGVLAQDLGDYGAARPLLEESLSVRRELNDPWGVGTSLHNLASMAACQGEYEDASALNEESLAIRREIGDLWGVAASLTSLGWIEHCRGDSTAARALYEESLAICRELGDQRGIGSALHSLAHIASDLGDYAEASALHEQGLTVCRQLDDKVGMESALEGLGYLAYRRGDYGTARALLEQSLALARELGDKGQEAGLLIALGNVAQAQSDHEGARSLYEESLGRYRELGEMRGMAWSLENLGTVALDRGDTVAARALHTESLAIRRELRERLNIASSLYNLGNVALFEKDDGAARAFYIESLAIRREAGRKLAIIECLEGLAAVDNAGGKAERAVRLFSAAAALRETIGVPLPPSGRAHQDRYIASLRAALAEQRFAAAWAQGQGWTLEEAIGAALTES